MAVYRISPKLGQYQLQARNDSGTHIQAGRSGVSAAAAVVVVCALIAISKKHFIYANWKGNFPIFFFFFCFCV